jgi:hypothetical protein
VSFVVHDGRGSVTVNVDPRPSPSLTAANLNGDVWTVTGKVLPPETIGGVAEADIAKRDGRILRVIHGQ